MNRRAPIRSSLSRLALALALAASWGCDPAADVEPEICRKPEPAKARLGVGDKSTGFIPVSDGDGATVVLGPQGLHMVVLSVRLEGFELPSVGGSRSRIQAAVREDGVVVAGAVEPATQPSSIQADNVEFLGIRATFQADDVDVFNGVLADVSVQVRDGCGREIRTSNKLKLHVPSAE